MDDKSVNCIITSPPYWAMRKYDNAENENEVGNELDFRDYVKVLTSIFTEAKRVLSDEGSLWLNIGDKYNNKALMGMPWRVALTLMDNGWILRNDVIWNQMKGTQSCKDRLRDMYEHVFHFVKSRKYYYDADEIKVLPTLKPKKVNGQMISATGVSGKKYRKMIAESIELTEQEKENALKALDDTLLKIQQGEINDFRMTIRGVQRAWHSEDTEISGRAKHSSRRHLAKRQPLRSVSRRTSAYSHFGHLPRKRYRPRPIQWHWKHSFSGIEIGKKRNRYRLERRIQ